MRKSLASCVTVVALLASGLAHAEDAKQYPQCSHEPTETDLTAAKGAFQAGNASFDEADYPRAIVYWEDAYRRDCTAHALLLNLARAYELNGNKPQAVVALQTYIARVPASPDKDKIQRRLEVIQKQIDADRAQAAAATAQPAAPIPPAAAPSPAAPSPPAEEPDSGGKRPILPLVVAGAGAGIAVIGTVLYATGRSDLSKAEDKCPNRRCSADSSAAADGNSARKRVTLGGTLTVTGILVAGGGLVWYFLSPKSAPTAQTARVLTPVAAPNYLGLSYSGAF
jgi:tetratricopeptide (TPR) repeat protein